MNNVGLEGSSEKKLVLSYKSINKPVAEVVVTVEPSFALSIRFVQLVGDVVVLVVIVVAEASLALPVTAAQVIFGVEVVVAVAVIGAAGEIVSRAKGAVSVITGVGTVVGVVVLAGGLGRLGTGGTTGLEVVVLDLLPIGIC